MSDYIEALKIELEGYVRRGLKDRADQVRKILADAGVSSQAKPEVEVASIEPEAERAIVRKARKRKA